MTVRVLRDEGKGRPFGFVCEDASHAALVGQAFDALAKKTRVLLIELGPITDTNWSTLTQELRDLLTRLSVRQISFVCFGSAGTIVQNVCLVDLKLVRSIVFIDATTRPHPTFWSKTIDALEEKLPLGLPLRLRSVGFDGNSFLQRIRCPALVVTSPHASTYEKRQAKVLGEKLPTAWLAELAEPGAVEQLNSMILDFQQIPAKCPQKNVGA